MNCNKAAIRPATTPAQIALTKRFLIMVQWQGKAIAWRWSWAASCKAVACAYPDANNNASPVTKVTTIPAVAGVET